MEVEVKNLEAIDVVGIRHIGPYPEIGKKFRELTQTLKREGIEHGEYIGIFHDDPTSVPEDQLRSDAMVVVKSASDVTTSELNHHQIAAGKYAVGTFVGDYSGLPQAWIWIFSEWMKVSGQQQGIGDCFERYVGEDEQNPAANVTEICIPLV